MALHVPYDGQQERCLVKKQGCYGKGPYMALEIFRNDDFDSEAIDRITKLIN